MKKISLFTIFVVALTAFISTETFATQYSDIAGHSDEKFIIEYSSKGLVDGYPDGTFKPDYPITRAEAAALLSRLNLPSITTQYNGFSDVLPSDWYYEHVNGAVKSGIVKGYNEGIFKPQNNITRFEAISIISNLTRSENYNAVQVAYLDKDLIPSWVDNSVRNLLAAEVIDKYDGNKIEGNTYITRGEMIRMLNKTMQINNWDVARAAKTVVENATDPLPKTTEIPHGTLGYLTINSIQIDNYPIEDGADLTTIKNAIGHFSETPVWDGNVGLCAHNRDYKYDFRNLKNVAIGDKVTYKTRFGERTYNISVIKPIEETDWNDILTTDETNKITMVTCIEEQPTKRLLVQAVQE